MDNQEYLRYKKLQELQFEVYMELIRTRETFPPMQSSHEGYAILLEKVDELWEEVRGDRKDPAIYRRAMRKEATQIAAMALAFLLEVCEPIDYTGVSK